MIKAKDYWQHLERNCKPKRPVFTHAFARGESLDTDTFAEIRRVAFELFARSLDPANPIASRTKAGQDEIYGKLNATKSFTLIKNPDLLTELDFHLAQMMRERGLLEGMEGFEFPANVRCVHPRPPQGYTDGAYATDHRHCDPWVGAPPDLINCFLYIHCSKETSMLELYDVTTESREEVSKFKGAYRDGAHLVHDLKPIAHEPTSGDFLMFDAFVPHQTIRRGGDVRLSVDFRVRAKDPYLYLEKKPEEGFLGEDRFCDAYWYANSGSAHKFTERWSQESERLALAQNNKALEIRKSTFERLK